MRRQEFRIITRLGSRKRFPVPTTACRFRARLNLDNSRRAEQGAMFCDRDVAVLEAYHSALCCTWIRESPYQGKLEVRRDIIDISGTYLHLMPQARSACRPLLPAGRGSLRETWADAPVPLWMSVDDTPN